MSSIALVLEALRAGIPVLALQMVATGALLAIGIAAYLWITPFNERVLIEHGNMAAGILMTGSILSLAIPLAATLAVHADALDILVWGAVALAIQLGYFAIASWRQHLRAKIEANNAAAALVMVGGQLAIALLNAGAMAG